jgi:hypothetical protein
MKFNTLKKRLNLTNGQLSSFLEKLSIKPFYSKPAKGWRPEVNYTKNDLEKIRKYIK